MSGWGFQAVCRWPGIIRRLLGVIFATATTALQHLLVAKRSSQKLAAENLFLRKQLALFKERAIKPRRADDATRAVLVRLCQAFNRPDALIVVKPATLIRWHPTDGLDIRPSGVPPKADSRGIIVTVG